MTSAGTAALPIVLALISAFLFALSDHLANRGLASADARGGAVVSVVASAAAFWCVAPFVVHAGWFATGAALVFAAIGLFRPALSIWLSLIGIRRLGPTLASAFSSTTPIWGGLLAVALLGERLTPPIAVGTLAVVAGAVLAGWTRKGVPRQWPLWAIAFPVGAAIIRSIGHVATKYGFGELPQPFFASLLATTVSAGVLTAAFYGRGQRLGSLERYRWFIAGGTINGLSIYSLNTALEQGSVVTVLPISSSVPVFTLLLGWLVFRRETIGWRTVATIALIVPGIVLVALR